MKTTTIFVLAIFILFSIIIAEGEENQKPQWKGKIEYENGIKVIKNPKEPLYKENILNLEEEFTIDTERDEFAELGLTDIFGFDVDLEGNIYCGVPRPPDYLIYKFDNNGLFVKGFIKIGQGPEEITNLTGVDINCNDEIEIHQHKEGRIYFFDKDGNFIREKVHDSLALFSQVIPLENGNYLVFWRDGDLYTGGTRFIGVVNSQFEERKTLDTIEAPGFQKKIIAIPFNFRWVASKKNIFLGNEEKGYEIWVFDLDGNPIKIIKKEYEPEVISKKYKKTFLKRIPDDYPFKKKYYFPDHWPPFHAFFTDNKGRLFVRTNEKGKNPGEYIHDIFSQEGFYMGRKSLNIYWIGRAGWDEYAEIKNNRLYCLQEKESGYKELVVYKMRWE